MAEIKTFETGATRESANDKPDYEGFLSPLVMERYAQYMHKNRFLADGTFRDSDNWQRGMPLSVYMKSMFRHFMAVWKFHRSDVKNVEQLEEDLCGLYFNVQGYFHTILQTKNLSSGEPSQSRSPSNSRFAP